MSSGRLPDFYILGAMKAATTTLAHQLGAQAGIAMSREKEPDWFADEAARARGAGWYEGLWSGAADGDLLGEASTSYAKWPDRQGVPARVKAATPDAKFIYMIRQPIARARSHALHEIRKRRGEEINAIARQEPGIWQYGCYATQLEQWLEHFPPERFLLVAAERLKAEPESEFTRVLNYLGREGAWSEEISRLHRSADGYRALPLEGALEKTSLFRIIRKHLVPVGLKRALRRARAIDASQTFTAETVRYLEEKTGPDLVRLGHMCGVELSLENYRDTVLSRHLTLTAG